jgi:hypothetical protein
MKLKLFVWYSLVLKEDSPKKQWNLDKNYRESVTTSE